MILEYDQFKQLLTDYCKENNFTLNTTRNASEHIIIADCYSIVIMYDWSHHNNEPVMHFDVRTIHSPGNTDHIISFDIYQDVEIFKRTLVELNEFARNTIKQIEICRSNIRNNFEVSVGTTITHFYY